MPNGLLFSVPACSRFPKTIVCRTELNRASVKGGIELLTCNSACNVGSDSLLMQFGICLALSLGENQRHATSTSPLQSGAGRVRC
jgi:hypothetical protein